MHSGLFFFRPEVTPLGVQAKVGNSQRGGGGVGSHQGGT